MAWLHFFSSGATPAEPLPLAACIPPLCMSLPLIIPAMPMSARGDAADPDRGPAYEHEHVHAVYEQIASHFSSTRYKVCTCMPPRSAHLPSSSPVQ